MICTDDLARSRVALWKRSRHKFDPASAALKAPWPRGLPIQCLIGPINIAMDSAFAQTPFMADRAAEVVMADPTIVLVDVTDDKETRRAIGQFVDSFDIALAIYVMQCSPGYERDSRCTLRGLTLSRHCHKDHLKGCLRMKLSCSGRTSSRERCPRCKFRVQR